MAHSQLEATVRRAVLAAALTTLAWRIRPRIDLRHYEVVADASAAQLMSEMAARLREGGDVTADHGHTIVARFSGSLGPVRWETVEEVRFKATRIEFEHVAGTFPGTREVFRFATHGTRTRLEHDGRLAMPGGLIGWALGLTMVRRLFEEHVAEHMDAAAARHASR